nr:MAG TPA: tail tape measure protein [Caudoviricetes sp.]
MADVKASVLLTLKDLYSKELGKMGTATKKFSSDTLAAVNKIDGVFSGMKTKLGAIGVSLSLGAASNEIIDLDARLTRMGMTADASAEQINALKQKIFEAAQDPNIKIDPSKIVDALDVVMTKTGSLEYVEANIKNIAVALQASGAAGEEMGDVFSEFQKKGFAAAEISQLMDDLVKQGDQGEYTFQKFAKTGKAVLSSYSTIGSTVEDVKKLNAVMQILVADTKNEELAATALDAVIAELSDPNKQEKLGIIGVRVRDSAGEFRDLAEIMDDVLAVAQKEGNIDFLSEVFGVTSMKAVRAFQNYGKNYKKLTDDLGDTTGALEAKSARMAGTMKANLQNLQTTFLKFADTNLAKPLERLNDLLSYLAEKPERLEKVFNTIKYGLGAIVAVKGLAKVSGFIGSISSGIRTLTGGSMQAALGGALPGNGAGAASGLPVFVTNMGQGGMGASDNMAESALSGGKPAGSRLSFKQGAALAGVAALSSALVAVPQMLGELNDIDNNPELKGKEKSKAKGGAVGAAVGSIGGAAAGALAGAAIGSVVPVIGTAIGGLVGGAIGWFGGKLGRTVGEKIGEAVGKDEVIPESAAVREELETVQQLPATPVTAELTGNAVMDLNINLSGERPTVSAKVQRNSTPFQYNTGRIQEAREAF